MPEANTPAIMTSTANVMAYADMGVDAHDRRRNDSSETGQGRAESKHQRKQSIDIDAERGNHFPVVDTGPERGANQSAVDHQYERKRDCNADCNDEQAIERI